MEAICKYLSKILNKLEMKVNRSEGNPTFKVRILIDSSTINSESRKIVRNGNLPCSTFFVNGTISLCSKA